MKTPRKSGVATLANPLATRLGYQLRRASVLMMADLDTRLAPTGLRPAELTILLLIGANSGCRQGEVGDMLGIKRSNMVPLIANLMSKGLVARTRTDGRSTALSLTAKGRAMALSGNRLIDRHEAVFRARLDSRALDSLLAALATLNGQVEV
ncbi:MAG: MarR family transcriptional regulator [Steroidobacteraceae bacterium]